MGKIRLVLVQMSPASRALALAGTQEAFPDAKVVEVGTLEEAEQLPTTDGEADTVLLVLAGVTAAMVRRAEGACDAAGRPRWGLVILGPHLSPSAESLSPEDWTPRALARVLRTALRQHELRAQILRLQGDLGTVAKRFTHDCRAPLTSIFTACEVLGEQAEDDQVSVAEMTRIIRDSSLELAELIDRVGFVLKASLGPRVPVTVDMGVVVASVVRQLAEDFQSGQATLTQPESWPEVTGVAQWLETIWWNLLKNALQHGGPAAQVRIGWQITGDECRYTVTDHGPGVATARQGALFSPFDQLHGLRSHGLGLSLVRRLVDLHAGTCGYEAMPDGGACFSFTLPLRRPPSAGSGQG